MSRKCGCLILISSIFVSWIFVIFEILLTPTHIESTIAKYVSPDTKQCIELTYDMESKKISFYYVDIDSNAKEYLCKTETEFYTTPRSNNYNVVIYNNIATITIEKENLIKEMFEVNFDRQISVVKIK